MRGQSFFGKDFDTGDLGIELEVATLTSLSLPYQLTLGKFKPQFGKVNVLHPHYFSFIDFPKMVNNFFDSEGMFMEGVSASWLVPNPLNFYQELIVEVGRVGINTYKTTEDLQHRSEQMRASKRIPIYSTTTLPRWLRH